jgi:hypothetical protein
MRAGVAIHRLGSARVSRAWRLRPRGRELSRGYQIGSGPRQKACFGATPKPTREDACATRRRCNGVSSFLRHSSLRFVIVQCREHEHEQEQEQE